MQQTWPVDITNTFPGLGPHLEVSCEGTVPAWRRHSAVFLYGL